MKLVASDSRHGGHSNASETIPVSPIKHRKEEPVVYRRKAKIPCAIPNAAYIPAYAVSGRWKELVVRVSERMRCVCWADLLGLPPDQYVGVQDLDFGYMAWLHDG